MASATRSSSSVVELSSDVNTTVEKLQELRNDLELNKTALFISEFHSIAPNVISALNDLDAVRLKAHDKLEVESITANVLRYRLEIHSIKLLEEAADAVGSARASNEDLLKQLKDKIDCMNRDSTDLVRKHEIYELHNDRIQSELKETQSHHDEQIVRLNEKISERSGLQILLNDTTDELRSSTKQIQCLTDEANSLDLIVKAKKDEFDIEKDNLIRRIDETKVKLNQQYMENYKLKKEVQDLQDETTRVGFVIYETVRDISEAEKAIDDLIQLEENMKETIVKTERENIAIENISKSIAGDIIELERDFKQKQKKKESTLKLLTNEVQQTKKQNELLKTTRKETYKVLKEAKEKSQANSLADIRRTVDSSKKMLLTESEAGVRLTSEKEEIEYRLLSLRETHKVTVQLLQEEIIELKEKLLKERKTRETVEDSYNILQNTIQEQLSDHCQIMSLLSKDITDDELKETNMIAMSQQLQTEILTNEQNITSLTQELDVITSRLQFVNNDLEERITDTENCIANLKEDNYENSESLLVLEPDIATLEINYTALSEKYGQLKKDMIALKNRKSGLQDTCSRLERDLGKMSIPQDKLRMETLSCRAYTRQWLLEKINNVEDIEGKVSEGEMKLNSITTQNKRFTKAIQSLHCECEKLKSIRNKSSQMEATMIKRLTDIKAFLEEKWKQNQQVAKHYSDLDKGTLHDLEDYELEWNERVKWIREITQQFERELHQFSTFIQDIAK